MEQTQTTKKTKRNKNKIWKTTGKIKKTKKQNGNN